MLPTSITPLSLIRSLRCILHRLLRMHSQRRGAQPEKQAHHPLMNLSPILHIVVEGFAQPQRTILKARIRLCPHERGAGIRVGALDLLTLGIQVQIVLPLLIVNADIGILVSFSSASFKMAIP